MPEDDPENIEGQGNIAWHSRRFVTTPSLIVGDEHVLPIDQLHSFRRDRRNERGQPECQAHVHLSLDPCAITKRSDRESAIARIADVVGNVARPDDISGREFEDFSLSVAPIT